MKKIIIYGLLFIIGIASCRKSDNDKLPALSEVPLPFLSADTTFDTQISPSNPASFKGRVILNLQFPDKIHPKKFTAVIIKNDDNNSIKVLQDNITTFPATVDITGGQLVTIFNEPIADGDKFKIGVDITTQDGQVYQAFPLIGQAQGSNVANQEGGTSTTVEYIKPCKYDPNIYVGDFVVVQDDWSDYSAGSPITVNVVGRDTLSFNYLTSPSLPIYVKVDTVKNITSVVKQDYGKYGADLFSCESVKSKANFVDPCKGMLSVTLKHTQGATNYGTYTIVMQKK